MSDAPQPDDTVETTRVVKYSLGNGHAAELEAGRKGIVEAIAVGHDGTTVLTKFDNVALILWVHASNLKVVQ